MIAIEIAIFPRECRGARGAFLTRGPSGFAEYIKQLTEGTWSPQVVCTTRRSIRLSGSDALVAVARGPYTPAYPPARADGRPGCLSLCNSITKRGASKNSAAIDRAPGARPKSDEFFEAPLLVIEISLGTGIFIFGKGSRRR